MNDTPIRIVLGKLGLDLHDVGVKFIARGLREAGMEVIYLGPFQTAESIVGAATTEDADVVAVSNISGEYMIYVPEIMDGLRKLDLDPIVIVGGLVTGDDEKTLLEAGVDAVYGQGSSLDSIVAFIRDAVAKRSATRNA